MRMRYSILQLIISIILIFASIYTFLKTSIYSNIAQLFLQIPASTVSILFIALLFTFLYLTLVKKLELNVFVHGLTFLLYLPSILTFSNINPLNTLRYELGSSLSFITTLFFGVLILAGNLILYQLTELKQAHLELLKRGASEKSLNKVFKMQFLYTSFFIVISGGLSFLVALLSSRVGPALSLISSRIPLTHLIIGVVGVTIALTTASIYLLVIRRE